jgi:AMMECR1 domain-containing protein
VAVGRHGLIISHQGYRGLLLPQVPVEHGWDRITFLEQTCRKAGLPVNAWKSGVTIEAFTAEVFGDPAAES